MVLPGTVGYSDFVKSSFQSTDKNPNVMSYNWASLDSLTLSGQVYQAACFWDANESLVVATRIRGGVWTLRTYDGDANSPAIKKEYDDNHNTCVLALDPAGYLHLAYDHHNHALNYRRSSSPINTFDGSLTAELSMLGSNESTVSYPCFFRDHGNAKLYFIFRDGGSGSGNMYFYEYIHSTSTWAAAGGTTAGLVINGKGSSPTQSPYWYGRPAFTSNWDGAGTGRMFLAWTWRETTSGTTNSDPSCVLWDGSSWTQMDGTAQTVPITLANCDKIETLAKGNSLSGFSGCASDSSGNFHTVYQKIDGSSNVQLYHAYYDSGWTITAATSGASNSFSAPDLIIDSSDVVYILARNSAGTAGMYAYYASSPYTGWTAELLTSALSPLYASNNGRLSYDRYQWIENNIYEALIDRSSIA